MLSISLVWKVLLKNVEETKSVVVVCAALNCSPPDITVITLTRRRNLRYAKGRVILLQTISCMLLCSWINGTLYFHACAWVDLPYLGCKYCVVVSS